MCTVQISDFEPLNKKAVAELIMKCGYGISNEFRQLRMSEIHDSTDLLYITLEANRSLAKQLISFKKRQVIGTLIFGSSGETHGRMKTHGVNFKECMVDLSKNISETMHIDIDVTVTDFSPLIERCYGGSGSV